MRHPKFCEKLTFCIAPLSRSLSVYLSPKGEVLDPTNGDAQKEEGIQRIIASLYFNPKIDNIGVHTHPHTHTQRHTEARLSSCPYIFFPKVFILI